MEYQVDLSRLENIVERVLGGYRELKEKKSELENTILEHEATIRRLQDEISALRDEQATVLHRVSSLIGTIEDWEKANVQVVESSLFSGQ